MTRFNITMNEALDLIMRGIQYKGGGIVIIPKLKAYRVEDMKNAITELLHGKNEVDIIPVRPGEKYHESLISIDEIRNTYETKDDYIFYEKIDEKFLEIEAIEKNISNREDLIGRNEKYIIKNLDNSFPKYILENKNKLKAWIAE
mgnify:CR=1 FL=1